MDFFAELRTLLLSRPHGAVHSRGCENAAFGDYLVRSKNIYVSYFVSDSQDCYYGDSLWKCRDCVDCLACWACELCYECTDCSGIYRGSHLQDCHNCSDCDFCFDCLNCKDCFGCFGLRQRQFCIFNKPYSEQTYREKLAQLRRNPPEKILSVLMPEFDKHPRLFARQLKGGENSYGDYIYFSKNCFQCYGVRNAENCAYVSECMDAERTCRDSVDCTYGAGLESCFECFDTVDSASCNFLLSCSSCSDSEYLRDCHNCQNCFGCAYLMNKQYCILNRQFSRAEYLAALPKIKGELKQAGTYGKTLAEIINSANL